MDSYTIHQVHHVKGDGCVRMAELSRSSGVPVATVKYYLREGLLPPGEPTGRNQAAYTQAHVHRLHLVRALLEVGRLPVASVRRVLEAVDDETLPLHEMLGAATHAQPPPAPRVGVVPEDARRAAAEVDAYLVHLGWRVGAQAPARQALTDTLLVLRRLGRDVGPEVFGPYAEMAETLAGAELAFVSATGARAEVAESVVVGTVVFEAALVALRRLAHEHHSAIRFGGAQAKVSQVATSPEA